MHGRARPYGNAYRSWKGEELVCLVQALLEQCQFIKVKRLFLFMEEFVGHSWLKHLKTDKIDLGKGKRNVCLLKMVFTMTRFQITIRKRISRLFFMGHTRRDNGYFLNVLPESFNCVAMDGGHCLSLCLFGICYACRWALI